MMVGFEVGVRVKGKPGTEDADKIGTITEKQRFLNGGKGLVSVLFVRWDEEEEEVEKNEDELNIA